MNQIKSRDILVLLGQSVLIAFVYMVFQRLGESAGFIPTMLLSNLAIYPGLEGVIVYMMWFILAIFFGLLLAKTLIK